MKYYKEYLKHIRDEIDFLFRQAEGMSFEQFLADEALKRAFVRSFEIIGEAAKRLPEPIRQQYPHVPWKRIAGTRDVLIHHYYQVDYELLWQTIREKLPVLKDTTHNILQDNQDI
jgi:uncharacterized protein with HEPN domain